MKIASRVGQGFDRVCGQQLLFLGLLLLLVLSSQSAMVVVLGFLLLWCVDHSRVFQSLVKSNQQDLLVGLLGLSVPLACLLSPDVLSAVALVVLCVASNKSQRGCFGHFKLLLVLWLLIALWRDLAVFQLSGFSWYWVLNHHVLPSIAAHRVVTSLVVFCGCFALFSEGGCAVRMSFFYGLRIGLWISVMMVALQLSQVLNLEQTSPFWRFVQRHSGTYTDPNAWGVAVVCLVPILWKQRSFALLGCSVLLGMFSGSRLLLLALVLFGAVALWRSLRRRSWCFCCFPVVFGVFIVGYIWTGCYVPAPLVRQFSALNFVNLADTFDSRLKFWRLAVAVWKDHFLAGAGLGQFQSLMTSYAAATGDNLNLWVDNANSLYLWVLAEFGLLGAVSLLLDGTQISWRKSSHWVSVTGAIVLLLILQFGPHLYFVEFSILAAYVFSAVFCRKKRVVHSDSHDHQANFGFSALWMCLLCVGVSVWSTVTTHGWYGWEREGSFYQRWAGPHARAFFNCPVNEPVRFQLRVFAPTQLVLESQMGKQPLDLPAGEWVPVSIPCEAAPRTVVFRSSRAWVPALETGGSDWRLLGFQLRTYPQRAFILS